MRGILFTLWVMLMAVGVIIALVVLADFVAARERRRRWRR